jgi:hypothetical protein
MGEALNVRERAMSAEYSISGIDTTLASEVSFTTSMVLETRSGSTLRTACGSTTKRNVCVALSPVERAARSVEFPQPDLQVPKRSVCHPPVHPGWRAIDYLLEYPLGFAPAPQLHQATGQFATKAIAPVALDPELARGRDSFPRDRDRLLHVARLVQGAAAVGVATVYLVGEAQAACDRAGLTRRPHRLVELAEHAEIPAHRVEHVRLDRLSAHQAGNRERLCAARVRLGRAIAQHQRLSLRSQYQRTLLRRRIGGHQVHGAPKREQRLLVTPGDP